MASANILEYLENLEPGVLITIILLIFVLGVGVYTYVSFAFMAMGRKAGLKHPGLAWIPGYGMVIIAFQASKMHWWPWLLLIGFLIPFINIIAIVVFLVYTVIWDWKLLEAISKPSWWALLFFIPVVNLIMFGIAAWRN